MWLIRFNNQILYGTGVKWLSALIIHDNCIIIGGQFHYRNVHLSETGEDRCQGTYNVCSILDFRLVVIWHYINVSNGGLITYFHSRAVTQVALNSIECVSELPIKFECTNLISRAARNRIFFLRKKFFVKVWVENLKYPKTSLRSSKFLTDGRFSIHLIDMRQRT